MTRTESPSPVRLRRGAGWVPADSTLVARPDHSFAPKATLADVRLASGSGDEPLLSLTANGVTTGLDWTGDLPAPQVKGSVATYPEVLPGVDLSVETTVDAVHEVLVVKNAQAAANPVLRKLTMPVPLRNGTLSRDSDGSLHVRDRSGAEVFQAPPATMWDSSGVQAQDQDLLLAPAPQGRTAAVATAVHGSTVSLSPDAAMLADHSVTYPLYIDPTWQAKYCSSCGRNHYLVEYACGSGRTPGEHPWDSADALATGYIDDPDATCSSSLVTARSFVEMNLGGLAGKQIIGAQLTLSIMNCRTATPSSSTVLRSNSIHYGDGWGSPSTAAAIGTVTACSGGKGFNVTSIIQELTDAGGPTFTFSIRASSENDLNNSWRKFSKEVGFSVTYNTKPNNPRNPHVYNGTQQFPCVTGANRPVLGPTSTGYVGKANVSDADGGMLWAGFHLYKGTTDLGETGIDNVPSDSNSAHPNAQVTFPSSKLATDGVYKFTARAYDGKDYSPGSSAPCEFELELQPPAPPSVTSDLYLPNVPAGGPGEAGSFTFTVTGSPTPVDHYVWKIDNTATPNCQGTEPGTAPAAGYNGPATAAIAPPSKGTHVLSAWSCNRARTPSSRVDYTFIAGDANPPNASWQFEGDGASSVPGLRYAGLGTGDFGAGKLGDAARLSGQPGDYFATASAVSYVENSYAVAAWVSVDQLQGKQVILSQDGTTASAYTLQYDAATNHWGFAVATQTSGDPAYATAESTSTPQAGTWTFLTGVYNASTHAATLYVNGQAQATVPAIGVASTGSLVIGAGKANGGRTNQLAGAVDEVTVFNRAITAAEVTTLYGNTGVPTGLTAHREYKLDDTLVDASGVDSRLNWLPGTTLGTGYSNAPARSGTDDSIGQSQGQAFVGNGTTAAGQVDGPAVDTSRSFTISAWAKLTDKSTNRAIAGQNSPQAPSAELYYAKAIDRWTIAMPETSGYDDQRRAVSAAPPTLGVWTHLIGVYDANSGTLALYVNGVKESQVTIPAGTAWQSANPFTVGAAVRTGTLSHYFAGSIDQVQVWDRALAPAEATGLANTPVLRANYQLTEADPSTLPSAVASWDLDETDGTTATDASGNGMDATATGTVSWGPGSTAGGVHLDGTGYLATAGPVVDTGESFSASAWVKLDDVDNYFYGVLGQRGTTQSGFLLRYDPGIKHWAFGIPRSDATDATIDYAIGTATPQVGKWTHLAVVFDRPTGELRLYVDGVLDARYAPPNGSPWNAAGPFTIGSYEWNGQLIHNVHGTIDEVRVFGEALNGGQVATLARVGHDSVSDAVTTASGNASLMVDDEGVPLAHFNGVRASRLTAPRPADLRTDGSFTVEAWVRHTWTDQDAEAARGRDPANTNGADVTARTAVALDDSEFSPFLLGYRGIHDADGNVHPRWSFVFTDPSTTVAHPTGWFDTMSVDAQDNTWTHLAATYDAESNTVCLYAATDSILFTPACVTGPPGWSGHDVLSKLLIGGDRWVAQDADPWYGDVRGVRLYSGVLSGEDISLHQLRDHP
ncbi:LamG domain-containing protein [Labedaea rhizosphaerae]|nr:LamG domain-containing protein [Labedaea rhizosphaerae]